MWTKIIKLAREWPRLFVRNFGVILVVLFGLFLESRTHSFLNTANFLNVLHHSTVIGLLALGLTFVVVVGEFDLGLANLNCLTGLVVAELIINQKWDTWPAITITVLAGLVSGMCIGYTVGYRRYKSIAMTLASANIFLGLAYLISEGQPIRGNLPASFRMLGTGSTLGLPNPVWILIACYAIGYFILHRHKVGHYLYALGGNLEVARAAGIPVNRLIMITFMISGGLAAMGACLNTAWIGSGQPSVGPAYVLPMFAAVFFGTAINGSRATLYGSLQGLLLIAVINNGTTLLGTPEFVNNILVGGLLLVSVLVARGPILWNWWRARRKTAATV